MFVAPHSKVVHVQVPVLLPGAVDVGHHLAAVDCAAHRAAPDGADDALEVLDLSHGLLQAQEAASHQVAAGHPDQAVLVEPDLRLPALAGWGSHAHFCKGRQVSTFLEERGVFSYLTARTSSASWPPSWDSLRRWEAHWT